MSKNSKKCTITAENIANCNSQNGAVRPDQGYRDNYTTRHRYFGKNEHKLAKKW